MKKAILTILVIPILVLIAYGPLEALSALGQVLGIVSKSILDFIRILFTLGFIQNKIEHLTTYIITGAIISLISGFLGIKIGRQGYKLGYTILAIPIGFIFSLVFQFT